MPLPINLADVLHGRAVEWERLEFKQGWNPEAVLHTLCAFANDFHNLGGGYVFIGIGAEDGRPVLPPAGVNANQLDRIQQEILRLGYLMTPHYHPVVEPYIIDGKHVVALWAPGGQSRPYKAPVTLAKDNREHAYYIRRASSTIRARREEETELIGLAAHIPFDDRVNQRAALADLKLPLIQGHLREIGSELLAESGRLEFAALCERMKIVDGPREHLWPRNVGLLFFNDAPEAFFPQTQIDVVQLPEGAGGDRIIESTFTGPLGQQLRDALAFIRNGILQEEVRKHPDRAEADRFFNYPYAAVEEALVNAVYHRSYEVREPIEVRVLPDHLTITSYPGPDRSISIADLDTGTFVARRYRNRRIGEFLKELRLTEGRGTGVPKIIRAMAANGSPPPQFRADEERTYFATILPIHRLLVQQVKQVGAHGAQVPDRLGLLTGEQLVRALGGAAVLTLSFCLDPRSREEIQRRLGESWSVSRVRSVLIQPLLKAALLEMTQPESPRSPTQKYRTTAVGVAVIQRTT